MDRLEYRIGRLVLQSHRQLLDGSAPVVIGRRALDLLSVLAAAEGSLVTKDELVRQVWSGAFVEDNAIQAQITAARKALGADADRLTTVRGMGYRLSIDDAPPQTCPAEAPPAPPAAHNAWRTRTLLVVASVAAVVVLATGALLLGGMRRRAEPLLALQPFDAAGQPAVARGLSSNLNGQVSAYLTTAGIEVATPGPHGAEHGTLDLSGTTKIDGSDLHVTAQVASADGRIVLWSKTFERPVAQADAMRDQVAAKLADVLLCALQPTRYPGGRPSPDTLPLHLRACDIEHEWGTSDHVLQVYQQIADVEPKFAPALSRLAMAQAASAFKMPPEQAAAVRAQARRNAQEALQIDPRQGLAYGALADAGLGEQRYDQLYELFRQGLDVDPANPILLEDQSELLLRMGRVDDASAQVRRAVSLQPWSPDFQLAGIQICLDQGHIDIARSLSAAALRLWPDNPRLLRQNAIIEARYGDIAAARAMIADPARRLATSEQTILPLLMSIRQAPDPKLVRRFTEEVQAAYRDQQLDLEEAVLDLAQVDAVDDAFALIGARSPASVQPLEMDPEFLWQPATLALRRDPRFMTVAAKFGLTAFWRRKGKWPDFCAAPDWPYDCRAASARPPPLTAAKAAPA